MDHARGKVIWGAEGRDAKTLDGFFDELGPQPSRALEAVLLDLGQVFVKSVATPGHAPQAVLRADPFHIVELVGDALRGPTRPLAWQTLRRHPDDRHAQSLEGCRWALL